MPAAQASRDRAHLRRSAERRAVELAAAWQQPAELVTAAEAVAAALQQAAEDCLRPDGRWQRAALPELARAVAANLHTTDWSSIDSLALDSEHPPPRLESLAGLTSALPLSRWAS